MGAFIVRRVLQSLPVFLGILIICFVLLKLAGDPVRVLVPEKAPEWQREKVRRQLGLDRPWFVQLGRYALGVVQGDLGSSYRHHRPVREMIASGAFVTAKLALGAMVIAVSLGLLSGLLSAHRPRTLVDYASAAGASVGVSIPAFWLAMLLTLLLGVKLEWLPISDYEPGHIEYLVIPVLTLGLLSTALIARLTRNCVTEALTQDYVRTARAKGLGRLQALLGHAFPNALLPVVTVIGTNLAGLLAGAVLTETACSLPGLGRVTFQAILERDHPVILGSCLFCACIFVLLNLVVDVLYAFLDPRVRQGS
jgi:ABC-type dipeptide/oligopeptide/nickel transport system permease component